jgi:GTP cyclohydrolase IA
METKFVNAASVAMMDKEDINNMQRVDTQKNQLIEGTAEYETIAYSKNNENTKTIEFVTESQDTSLKDNEKNENYTVNDLNQMFDYRNREITTNKNTINKKNIERLIRQLLIELGEDPDREGLVSTPRRIAEMYNEIFAGYTSHSELEVSFTEETDLIIAKDIQFYSMCEHHMLPFYGKIHIAYIPTKKVFGISKLVRLVEKYARRLQVQERLTKEIAEEIDSMGIKGVMVMAEGEHLCMKMRGVKNNSIIMTTTSRGIIKEQKEVRQDILAMLYNKS